MFDSLPSPENFDHPVSHQLHNPRRVNFRTLLFQLGLGSDNKMKQLNVKADQHSATVDDAVTHSKIASSLTAGLPRATLSRIQERPEHTDMPEQKRASLVVDPDDDLSEFERARRTSKTWSMGQD